MDRLNLTSDAVHVMLDGVMHAEIAYRQVVLSDRGEEKLRLPLLAPFNDVLGWQREDETYTSYLLGRYGSLGFAKGSIGESYKLESSFVVAARAAAKGRFAAELGDDLERVRFGAEGAVEDVADLAALGAWTLLEAVRRQPLKLWTCPICKKKWLGTHDETSPHCQRRAPGHAAKDCRTLAYERRVAGDENYGAYRREYKRVTEMERRGAIDPVDLYRWREANSAIDWTSFETWKERDDG